MVSDAATKRYSGSFTRETNTIQSRTPPLTDKNDHQSQMLSNAAPFERTAAGNALSSGRLVSRGSNPEFDSLEDADLVGAVGGEEQEDEGPTEELIHETAVNIACMGDELDSEYKARLEVSSISLTPFFTT